MLVPIKFVVTDWKKDDKSCMETEEGQDIALGSLGPGNMFIGSIDIELNELDELRENIKKGFEPVIKIVMK